MNFDASHREQDGSAVVRWVRVEQRARHKHVPTE
jgi:hypothetical protein